MVRNIQFEYVEIDHSIFVIAWILTLSLPVAPPDRWAYGHR